MAKPAKPAEETEDISQVEVRLKPILGIKPGVYMTGIYGVAVFFLLFMLLFNPGIRNNGTVYTVEIVPAGANSYWRTGSRPKRSWW